MISLPNIKKSRTVLALTLFLIGQCFAIAHAAEHGLGPHTHNGIACLANLNNEDDGPLPSTQLVILSLVINESERFPLSDQVLHTKNLAILPPPTGPPSSI